MRAAGSASELLADPVGGYFAARGFVVWIQSPTRMGVALQDIYDPADHAAAAQLLPICLHPALAPLFDVCFDAALLEVFDRAQFQLWSEFLSKSGSELSARIHRLAVVPAAGLPGASITGLIHMLLRPPIRVSQFETRADALSWLGIADDSADRRELDTMMDSFTRTSPIVRALRTALAVDLRTAALDDIAAKIGHSSRTLQRQLAELGTSFRDELIRARIQAAQVLLLETSELIETIAKTVGFGSAPAFISTFGRVVGESPARFRERRTQKTPRPVGSSTG